jgi:pimeloyl-ACP methyl ester carboxylesterase
MTDLSVEAHGSGEHVILVHGSLATGSEEWEAQQPLAEEGFRLLVVDRRGYGRSPSAEGEDFLRDAEDIAALMDGGAHLVGHSYGGLGAMAAAARRPDRDPVPDGDGASSAHDGPGRASGSRARGEVT